MNGVIMDMIYFYKKFNRERRKRMYQISRRKYQQNNLKIHPLDGRVGKAR